MNSNPNFDEPPIESPSSGSSFNSNSPVADTETLYRAVRAWPKYWKENGGLSPAAFKDSRGLSVDRNGDRNEDKVIQDFRKRKFEGTLISVGAKECKDLSVYLMPKPSNWIYHVLVLDSPTGIELSDEKCDNLRHIAKNVINL